MRFVLPFIKVLKMSRFFIKTKIKTFSSRPRPPFLLSMCLETKTQSKDNKDYISVNLRPEFEKCVEY